MRYSHHIKHGKRHSVIRQPPNLTLFSGPIECRIREGPLYIILRVVVYIRLIYSNISPIQIMVVMELLSNGDLNKYLTKQRER